MKKDKILELLRENKTIAEIRAEVDTPRAYIYRVAQAYGLKVTPRKTKKEQVLNMLKRKKTVNEIIQETGLTNQYIYQLARANNIILTNKDTRQQALIIKLLKENLSIKEVCERTGAHYETVRQRKVLLMKNMKRRIISPIWEDYIKRSPKTLKQLSIEFGLSEDTVRDIKEGTWNNLILYENSD